MATRAPGQRRQISQELYEKYTKNTIRSNRNDSTGTWTNEKIFRLIEKFELLDQFNGLNLYGMNKTILPYEPKTFKHFEIQFKSREGLMNFIGSIIRISTAFPRIRVTTKTSRETLLYFNCQLSAGRWLWRYKRNDNRLNEEHSDEARNRWCTQYPTWVRLWPPNQDHNRFVGNKNCHGETN